MTLLAQHWWIYVGTVAAVVFSIMSDIDRRARSSYEFYRLLNQIETRRSSAILRAPTGLVYENGDSVKPGTPIHWEYDAWKSR